MFDGLEASNPALDIFRFDVAALFGDAIAHPEWFGLANVTDSAAPGLQPGATSYNTSLIAPNANQYLFCDDLHPTATVHAILAERALMHLSTPGDFNRDGTVDAPDYVVWRKKSGSVLTPPDLGLWRVSYGEVSGAGAMAFAGSDVSESGAWQLFATAMAFVYGFNCRFRLQ